MAFRNWGLTSLAGDCGAGGALPQFHRHPGWCGVHSSPPSDAAALRDVSPSASPARLQARTAVVAAHQLGTRTGKANCEPDWASFVRVATGPHRSCGIARAPVVLTATCLISWLSPRQIVHGAKNTPPGSLREGKHALISRSPRDLARGEHSPRYRTKRADRKTTPFFSSRAVAWPNRIHAPHAARWRGGFWWVL